MAACSRARRQQPPPPAAPGRRPRGCHHSACRNPRRDNDLAISSPVGRSPGWSRPTCWRPRGAAGSPRCGARLSDRHPAGAPSTLPTVLDADGSALAPTPRWLNPCTPATGCATAALPAGRPARGGPPAPGNHDGRTGHTGEGAAVGGQRLQRRHPERHRCGAAVRPAGRCSPTNCRSNSGPRAPGGGHHAEGARRRRTRDYLVRATSS